MSARFVRLAPLEEVPEGAVRVYETEERDIAICNVGGSFYAVEDICTHDGGPLGDGDLDEFAIECPRHGARFDIRTGDVLCLPATVPIQTYPVKVEDGAIWVEVEED